MPRKQPIGLTLRFSQEEMNQLKSYHLEQASDVSFSRYVSQIAIGERPHPVYQNKSSILTNLLMNRLESLDLFIHYASSAVAGMVMHLPKDQHILANKEVFFELESEMRGYHYNEKTEERTSIYDNLQEQAAE